MSKVVTLSEAASIGLHGMILIAKAENEMVNVLKIAELTGSSKHHVAKVFQRLVKIGLLNSFRGPNGGFSLRKKANEISLLEIYEGIEGEIQISDCPMDHKICAFGKCILDNVTNKMTIQFKEFLQSQSLKDYL
ncbi:MAG: Rrf2 family transcriptional regulator [Bacteroidetes bacterium]|jgi:Rrf2 family protein|nr:Rrf2 family transcriptional regulator [Bacteroidota bacterium]MBT5529792.1 Rrf2 family transcriptional regulator [Cytophagia bacterium]MBT3422561.1 Rrf2 family transcriptional regulator [Bacteroidota bacterium]MBT3800493.1 Rrf2 family transcriptional regulator [Bacteroidota bacterium]MBT3934186.1 Rrf2 family transcriptional regulator [Bacteroidota bacterium]